MDSDGHVVVLFGTCPGEHVTNVAIVRSGATGGEGILWRATSTQGVSARRFQVSNEATPNMRIDIALDRALPADVPLVAEVATDHRPSVKVEFSKSQIREGMVFASDDESLSETAFLDRASADCS
jgi:hypothetical protein